MVIPTWKNIWTAWFHGRLIPNNHNRNAIEVISNNPYDEKNINFFYLFNTGTTPAIREYSPEIQH